MVAGMGIAVSVTRVQVPIVGQVVALLGEAVTTLDLELTEPDTSLLVRHHFTSPITLASSG